MFASDGGKAAEHEAYVAEHGLAGFPYVLSEALGRAYGVSKLPYAVLIDERGRIASLGLVNSGSTWKACLRPRSRTRLPFRTMRNGMGVASGRRMASASLRRRMFRRRLRKPLKRIRARLRPQFPCPPLKWRRPSELVRQ